MRRGQETSHPVEGRAQVVAGSRLHGPGVQRHSHPHGTDRAPLLDGQRPLGGQRGGEGVGSRAESGAELVAHRLEEVPVRRFDGTAQKIIVARQHFRHGSRVFLPEPRAAFDIGEKEGKGASGQWTVGSGQ